MYPGRRIGAILSIRDNEVRFLGYGVYEGDFPPSGLETPSFDEMIASFGDSLPLKENEMRSLYAVHFGAGGFMEKVRRQPRLRLDNGDFVWAGECYWDDEVSIRKRLTNKTVVAVRLERGDDGKVRDIISVPS